MLLRNGIQVLTGYSTQYFGNLSDSSYTEKFDEGSTTSSENYIGLSWNYKITTQENNVYTENAGRIVCSSSTVAVQPSDTQLDEPISDLVSMNNVQVKKMKFNMTDRPYIEYTQNLKNVGDTAVTVNKVAYYLCGNISDAYKSSDGQGAKFGEFSSPAAMILAQNLDTPVIVQAGETKAFLIRLYITD